MMIDSDLTTSKKLEMSLDDIGKAMGKGVRKSRDFKNLRDRNNGFRSRYGRSFNNRSNGFRNRDDRNVSRRSKFIIRVGNLNHSVTKDNLMEMFSSVGEVIKVWIDYDHTDRSKGTGGCIFKFTDDAKKAITKYNGSVIENKPIELHGEVIVRSGPRFRRYNNFNRPVGNFRRNRFNNTRSPW